VQDTDLLVRETRQLLEDVAEVAKDGRVLAQRLTETIENVVGLQCDAIEERVRGLLARIEAAERSLESNVQR
jgi:hypothetical protein